jgi:ubiquinone biosynthesis monooxygenase Coq7
MKSYNNTTASRNFSLIDVVISGIDQSVRTLFAPAIASRSSPAADVVETTLTLKEKKHSAGLMRVNHVGEVCAQALYQGQACTAYSSRQAMEMEAAAKEEVDHLAWCEQRLRELNSHTSYLNPVWYFGALSLGMIAGLLGDRWSLGFVAETEKQVVKHLDNHLGYLSEDDFKSRAIVEQMQVDEAAHQAMAIKNGAADLPEAIKFLMATAAKIMTTTAYYV